MHKTEMHDATFSMEMVSDPALDFDDVLALRLRQQFRSLTAVVPCSKFEVSKTPKPEGWDYTITASDGREWKQHLRFVNNDSEMTFDVQDYWRLSEFILGRGIRDTVIEMLKTYDIESIEISWY